MSWRTTVLMWGNGVARPVHENRGQYTYDRANRIWGVIHGSYHKKLFKTLHMFTWATSINSGAGALQLVTVIFTQLEVVTAFQCRVDSLLCCFKNIICKVIRQTLLS